MLPCEHLIVAISIQFYFLQFNQPNWGIWRKGVKCRGLVQRTHLRKLTSSDPELPRGCTGIQLLLFNYEWMRWGLNNVEKKIFKVALKVASNGKRRYEYLWVFSPHFLGSRTVNLRACIYQQYNFFFIIFFLNFVDNSCRCSVLKCTLGRFTKQKFWNFEKCPIFYCYMDQ